MPFCLRFATLCVLTGSVALAGETPLPVVQLAGVRREPVAGARHSDSHLVAIACAKSGTLIFWDWQRGEIRQEFTVGKELRGIVDIGRDEFLLIDSKQHELIQVRYANERLTELERYPLPDFPAAICRWGDAGDQTFVAITSLWGRKATVWEYGTSRKLQLLKAIDLPFEPRHVSVQQRNVKYLQVAAAFGGEMGEIEIPAGKLKTWRQPIHNIGGMTCDSGRYFITHQVLRSQLPTTEANLASGKLLQHRLTDELGPPSELNFSADPAGVALHGPVVLVCLAGTDEVAVTDKNLSVVKRIPVGRRPRTVVSIDSGHALVLGELDDSVTLIDSTDVKTAADFDKFKVATLLLDPRTAERELTPAERGERLFFSAKNSAGHRMSCHSCHTDGHTNGLLADTLGDNTHGTPKRVLTLRGTRLTDLWAWNGEMKTLQDNVHKSLQDTMHATKIDPADVDDLVSFLHTLPPVPPLKPVAKADRELVERGRKIFHRAACDQCHVPPLTFTSHASYDVGLSDEKGLKKFNPPSLRGVGRLKNLLHDNRATSLRDVFETHGHQLKEPLPENELRALVRFLESL